MAKPCKSRIIVTRELEWTNRKGRSARVRVLIEAPRLGKHDMATCRFKLEGLRKSKARWVRVHGIDELAALLTAIHIIHVHLYYRRSRMKRKLTWLGTRDLGVPLTAGPITNNRDAKGRVVRPKR